MRRIQLRQWILLILRCLIILTFVLAFARPTLRTTAGIGRRAARSSAVLVADNSLSMKRKGLFHSMQKNLDATLDLFSQEDDLVIYPVIPSPSQKSRSLTRGMLPYVGDTATWQYGDLYQALSESVNTMKQSSNLNQEIFLFSDFQRTGFPFQLDSSLVSYWNGRMFFIPEEGETENLGLVDGGIDGAVLHFNEPLTVFAKVKNFGMQHVRNQLVRLFIQNRPIAQKMIDVKAGETQRIHFNVTPQKGGWLFGSIHLEGDAFHPDDVWYFSEKIPDQIHILLVGSHSSDFRFLKLVLNPQNNQNTYFQIHPILDTQSWDENLNQWDVVFVINLPSFNHHQQIRIKQYLKNGGALFVIPGQTLDIRGTNANFLEPTLHVRWLKIRGNQNSLETFFSLGKTDIKHPVFEGVFKKGNTQFHSPQFYRVIEMDGDFITILSLANGDPLLVEKSLERGTVFILNTGLNPEWSNLAFSTLFSPLILRSVFYLSSPKQQFNEMFNVGEPVTFETETEDVANSYHVLTPQGEEILILPQIYQQKMLLQLNRSKAPGCYRFYREDEFLGMACVNVDSLESDFKPFPVKQLNTYFPHASLYEVQNADQIKDVVYESRFGKEIQKEMFFLCFLLLVIEMLVGRSGKKVHPKGMINGQHRKSI